jgi:hypothetical protein
MPIYRVIADFKIMTYVCAPDRLGAHNVFSRLMEEGVIRKDQATLSEERVQEVGPFETLSVLGTYDERRDS